MIASTDRVAGAAAIAAAIAVLAASGDLPVGTLAFPGAGMMPKLVCGLMILFGALLMVRGAGEPVAAAGWSDLPHALRVFAVTAAAVWFYTTLGFIVTMALLLFVLVALEISLSGSRSGFSILVAAAYGIGVSLLTYGLFTIVLKQPLEQGILGF